MHNFIERCESRHKIERERSRGVADDLAAYWALQWCSGTPQKKIAEDAGYKAPDKIRAAICNFIMDYVFCDSDWMFFEWNGSAYLSGGIRRLEMAKIAIGNFKKTREASANH